MNTHKTNYKFGLTIAMLLSAALAQNEWQDLKDKKGGSIQEVMDAYKSQIESNRAGKENDLTSALLSGPEFWELREKDDPRFMRWLDYVQPRLEDHQGQLDVLHRSLDEIAKLYPIGGPLPLMKGNWVPLGPRSGGTAGAGRLSSIEFHPTKENAYMVASPGGGIWTTTDGGTSWTTTTDFLPNACFQWGVWDPTNINTMYIGGGDADHNDCPGLGILKSLDGGKSWKPTGATMTWLPSQSRHITKLVMLSTGTLVVGSTLGVHTSTDGGATYVQATGVPNGASTTEGKIWDIEVKPGSSTVVYASTGTTFYRSEDGGKSFTSVASVSGSSNRVYISVSNSNPELVMALTSTRSAFNGIFRSTNSGTSFTSIATGSFASCSQAWYDVAFSVSHASADEIAIGCLSNYRSTNAGTSGTSLTGSHVDIHGLYYHPKTGALFSVNDGGVYRAPPGGNFTSLNNNIEISQGYRLGVLKNDFNHICTGRQDNGTDIRGGAGKPFSKALGADGMECFFNSTGTRWYGESQGGGWQGCNYSISTGASSNCTRLTPPGNSGAWDTPWGGSATNASTLYGSRADFLKSTDNGANWTALNPGGTGAFRNFAVEANGSEDVILLIQGTALRKSLNSGATWTSASGTGLPNSTPRHVAIHPSNPLIMAVVYSGFTANQKAYLTIDGGSTWTNISAGIPNVAAGAIAIDGKITNGPGIYIGTDAGVFFKDDRFTSCQNFSDALPNSSVREIEVNSNPSGTEKRVTVSTYGRGIWQTPTWDNAVSIDNRQLNANSGNIKIHNIPGSQQIRLTGGLKYFKEATLLITTLNGKSVYIENLRTPNFFDVLVDMSQHGKGIYMVMLKSGKDQLSQRIVIN